MEQTLFFRLLVAACIVKTVPFAAWVGRGLLGLLVVVGLALLVGAAQQQLANAARMTIDGIKGNRLEVWLLGLYAAGVLMNCLVRGNSWEDWRLIQLPLVDLAVLLFSVTFLRDETRGRALQIYIIAAWGLQSALSLPEVLSGQTAVREAVREGAWAYGNQAVFAGAAMILPLALWRALTERGPLRLFLLACIALMIALLALSTFATPTALLGIAVIVAAVLSIVLRTRVAPLWRTAIVVTALCTGALVAYQYLAELDQFQEVRTRLELAWTDPASGGYRGAYASESRWLLANMSIASFLQSPWFGKGGGHVHHSPFVGGHSSMFDTLGAYGLLGGGGAVVGLIGVLVLRALGRLLREGSWKSLSRVTTLILLAVGGVVNPYWDGGQLSLVFLVGGVVLPSRDRRWRSRPAMDQELARGMKMTVRAGAAPQRASDVCGAAASPAPQQASD